MLRAVRGHRGSPLDGIVSHHEGGGLPLPPQFPGNFHSCQVIATHHLNSLPPLVSQAEFGCWSKIVSLFFEIECIEKGLLELNGGCSYRRLSNHFKRGSQTLKTPKTECADLISPPPSLHTPKHILIPMIKSLHHKSTCIPPLSRAALLSLLDMPVDVYFSSLQNSAPSRVRAVASAAI